MTAEQTTDINSSLQASAEDQASPFRRIYVQGSQPDVQVPMKEIIQTDTPLAEGGVEHNPPITIYDTAGPYGDPAVEVDVNRGLAPMRDSWFARRTDVQPLESFSTALGQQAAQSPSLPLASKRQPLRAKPGANVSQMHYARQGIITEEMEFVAIRENQRLQEMQAAGLTPSRLHKGNNFGSEIPEKITPEYVRSEIAAGRAVIPANINHPELEPVIIGRNFLVKINANIGNSAVTSSITTPESAEFALTYAFESPFRLMASINWMAWSQFDVLEVTSLGTGDLLSYVPMNWSDTWYFAVGGEYDLNPSWLLRAGIAYDETPEQGSVSTRVPTGDRELITVGAGFSASDSLMVNMALMYFKEHAVKVVDDTFYLTTSGSPEPTDFTYSGTFKNSAWLIAADIVYKF